MKLHFRQIRGRRGLLLGSFLVVLACSSYLVGRYWNDALQQWLTYVRKGEIAEIDASSLDFGEVIAQEDFKWRIPIHNKSSRALEIGGWRVSCHCTAIEPETLTIPPGEVRDVALTMDLTPKKNEKRGATAWRFSIMVAPKITTPSYPPVVWNVHGNVNMTLVCEPDSIDFGESLVVGESFQPKSVDVTSHQRIHRLEANWDRSLATVDIQTTESDGQHFRVQVTPTKDLALGNHDFAVKLIGMAPNDKIVESTQLYVQASVVKDLVVTPSPLSLGSGVVGQVLEKTVILRSRTGRSFSLLGTRAENDETANFEILETQPVLQADHCMYTIRLRPLCSGVHTFTVLFQVQQSHTLPVDMPLSVCYSASSGSLIPNTNEHTLQPTELPNNTAIH